jgi:chromosome segregation ATPase
MEGVGDGDFAATEVGRLRELLAAKDSKAAAMQAKMKDYLANVDKKWQGRLSELEAHATASEVEAAKLRAAQSEDVEVLRAERDVAMQIAESEKRRADEALASLRSVTTAHAETQASAQMRASATALATAEATAAAEALRTEVAALRRADADMRVRTASAVKAGEEAKGSLSAAVAAMEASDERAAEAERQVAGLQASVAALTQQVEYARKDADTARRTAAESAAREANASGKAAEEAAKFARTDASRKAERTEAIATRARLEESLAVRNAERERLASEVARLTRQYEDTNADLRRSRAALSDAEATAMAARNALAIAESRGAEAEAKLGLLVSTAKSSDGTSGRLRVEAAAASADSSRLRAEIDRLSSDLAVCRGREAAMQSELESARTLAVDAQGTAAAAVSRAESAEVRAATAVRDANEHQRKRLEAKTELVAVAQYLEAEREASHAVAASLGSSVLPRLTALILGVHNLAATLDSSYTGGAARLAAAAAAEGEEEDEAEAASLVRRGDAGGLRAVRAAGRAGSEGGSSGLFLKNGLLMSGRGGVGSGAESVAEHLSGLVEEAQTGVYAATRAAAELARGGKQRRGRFGLGGGSTPLGGARAGAVARGVHGAGEAGEGRGGGGGQPLDFLTSCFRTAAEAGSAMLSPAPPLRAGGAGGGAGTAQYARVSAVGTPPKRAAPARDLDAGPGGLSSLQADTSSVRRLEGEERAFALQSGARGDASGASKGGPRRPPTAWGTASAGLDSY